MIGVNIRDVDLRHLCPLARSSIRHIESDIHLRIPPRRLRTYREIRELEGGIGKSIAKRKQRFDVIVLIAAIANEGTFLVDHASGAGFWIVVREGSIVLCVPLKSSGQMTGGVHLAEQDLGQYLACILSAIPSLQECRHTIQP